MTQLLIGVEGAFISVRELINQLCGLIRSLSDPNDPKIGGFIVFR
jgi:hypothetical protein